MGIKKFLRQLSSMASSSQDDGSDSSCEGTLVAEKKQQNFQEQEYLLDRLGGMIVLDSIVKEFCRRAIEDPNLQIFFKGIDQRILTAHQKNFFAMAFTSIHFEEAAARIRIVHRHLFAMPQGLNVHHFAIVLQHLNETLKDRGFVEAVILEVNATIAPLGKVFKEEAEKAATQHGIKEQSLPRTERLQTITNDE